MGLPEDEQRELDAIERRLAEDDPKFASKLVRPPPPHHRLPPRVLKLIGLLLIYVVGLVVVITGVSLSSIVLIALGAAVTAFSPVVVVVQTWRTRRNHEPSG
ncbi:DUF3040 domain-containing protein [Lentzea flaviverrucosa]|uniref:DUF3040 domain-containing protein n=1 Tax=Lentzea flaviverrucosa TaxID=200379 RepID=A0A1H9XW90_9PSEU|nr:DUF3040 domain-containing protein [Lentzea flaviverrucosa]RDI34377.1 DUF3040 family protein [Lentzea flaviverrucosa]SES50452.1 Protein of unknown function [Lentzea flaviverrucosa]